MRIIDMFKTENDPVYKLYSFKEPVSGTVYTIEDVFFECMETGDICRYDELNVTIYDDGYSATKTVDGTLRYYTVLKTPEGKVLPEHAFIYPVIPILFLGDVKEGKTCSILSFLHHKTQKILGSSGNFYACNDRNLDCSSSDDENFIKMLKGFEEGTLPDPTRLGESFKHIDILIKSGGRGMILSLYDMSGEEARKILTGSSVHNFEEIIYCISAKKLKTKGSILDDQPVLQRFITQQNRRRQKKAMMHILVTQADLILDDFALNEYNTINYETGELQHHGKEYDLDFHSETEEMVKSIIKIHNPSIFNLLMTNCREEALSFHITAAIGTEANGDRFESYKPFAPDEIWKYIFSAHGIYSTCGDEVQVVEQKTLVDCFKRVCNI